jgi:FAD/FMN-containing dehydrogenase
MALADPLLSPDLLDRFVTIVGRANAFTEAGEIAPYLIEDRGLYRGQAPLVLRPGSTEEVAAILKLAQETNTAVVPQGGNTGLVGAQTPYEDGRAIVLSLGRLNRIREVDAAGNTMTVEAGVILASAQEAAREADRLFPLSLGAEGTCQIGGNLSTNAGGTAVLAYGNTRDLVLGLEVVLADGRVWNGLRKLRKDNTGYDLKHLFVGAEGTLGVITAAVLKLFPYPRARETAFIGLADPRRALDLLNRMKAAAGPSLTSFELMPRIGIEFCLRHLAGARDPLSAPQEWYVLAEVSSGDAPERVRSLMEEVLGQAFEDGLVQDAALAESEAQAQEFWRMRTGLSEVQKPEGGSIKHDVSVPIAAVPDFLAQADAAVLAACPDARIVAFGHLGDGNIHYNVSQPVGADRAAFLARWDEVNSIVHEIVAAHGGSISAEHGIGRLKRHLMEEIKSPVELELMRGIKQLLDPKGILNPGKLL